MNGNRDIAKTLEKYPPHRLCDEWRFCADDCDIQARDMHCEDCDSYWELVELAEKGEIDLRDVEKEKGELQNKEVYAMTPQEAIKLIKDCGLNIKQPLHNIVADYIISILEKQIPKKPIRFHEEYDKHKWKRNPDGSINEEAWEWDIHEGVVCERCGAQFCTACDRNYDSYKCVIDKTFCPTCNSEVWSKRCYECDQLIDWRKEDV